MLSDDIRSRFKAAMKARNTVEKEILRVAIGEISATESRSGEKLDDAAVQKILRKLLKSNRETLKVADETATATLTEEIAVLESMLPKQLDEAGITAALAPVAEAIKAAAADGQATGVAMKHLKSSGAQVDGKLVAAAVKAMRAG